MLRARAALRQDVTRAAFASGAVEMVARALTIVLSIATARALEPQEVGLLGLAVIVTGILSVVTACAETAGVIGRSGGTDVQYAWVALTVRGVVTAGLLALAPLLLPVAAHILASKESANAELMALVWLLLWQLVLDLGATYPRVLLQRSLRLTPLAAASFLQVTVHVGVSLVLLRLGYGAMGVATAALVAGGVSATFLWSRLFAYPDPRWQGRISATLWKQASASTARVLASGFVGYLNGRVSSLLVAGMLGPAPMSFYGMAWSASRIPVWILNQALGLVLVPTLARIRGDAERTERVLLESLRHSYLLLVPACALLFVTADSLVVIVLGAKWLPVVPALRVMSVTVLLAPFGIVSNALLVATDRGHLTSLATGVQLAILAMTVAPLAVWLGPTGAACGDLVATAALTTTLILLCRHQEPQVKCWGASSALLPVLAAWCGGLLAAGLTAELPVGVMRLVSEISVSLGGYLVALWLLGGRGRLIDLVIVMRNAARRAAPAIATSGGSPTHGAG